MYTLFTFTLPNDSVYRKQIQKGSAFDTGFVDDKGNTVTYQLDVCAHKSNDEHTIFAVITENPDEVRNVLNYLVDASDAHCDECDVEEFEDVDTYTEAEDYAASEFLNF